MSSVSFLLAHLSDAHIGPIPRPNLAELLGKRATGYVNWLRKRAAQHDMSLLARLVDDLLAQKPDHVAMTGDIVNIGLSGEIALAREWLGRLGGPEQVSFSPGNHDAYVPGAMALLNEPLDATALLPKNRHFFRYEGSLTTPPCSEVVNWYVFSTPIAVATSDIETFKGIFPMNARPLQPLRRRMLLTD